MGKNNFNVSPTQHKTNCEGGILNPRLVCLFFFNTFFCFPKREMVETVRMMDPKLLWYFKVILSNLTSFVIGWVLVHKLRLLARNTDKIWKLTLPILITPISVFVVLHISSNYGLCDRVVADAFAFGIVIGILAKLNHKSDSNQMIKLVVHAPNGKRLEIWLTSVNEKACDVRDKIADALKIVPAKRNRIAFETGKGAALEDLSLPLFKALDTEKSLTTDFFGYISSSCCISINSEDVPIPKSESADEHDHGGPNGLKSTLSLFKPKEVKFDEHLLLTAKPPHASHDSKPFYISPAASFAAAAPNDQHQNTHIKFILWKYDQLDAFSEAGDSVMNGGPSMKKRPPAAPAATRTHEQQENKRHEPVRNGDTVFIECDGKYVSSPIPPSTHPPLTHNPTSIFCLFPPSSSLLLITALM